MAVNFPNDRREVVDRIKTDVQSALPVAQPFIPNSFIAAILTGFGGRVYDFYLQLKQVLKQMFMDTATGAYIARWGSYVNITQNRATFASGLNAVVLLGTDGVAIPNNTVLVSPTGNLYVTTSGLTIQNLITGISSLTRSGSSVTAVTSSAHNYANGMSVIIAGADQTDYNGTFIITINSTTSFSYTIGTSPITPATGTITSKITGAVGSVNASQVGPGSNLENGAQLSLQTSIPNVNNTVYVNVNGIGGGANDETPASYTQRVLYRYQNPHALFNAAQITSVAKAITGVLRVWVFNCIPEIGDVTVYFTRDNDDNPVPDPSEVALVRTAILAIKPADMENSYVIVDAPTLQNVDFQFNTLNPNTQEMQTAIKENLKFYFLDSGQVGEPDGSTIIPAEGYAAAIAQTVDSTGAIVESYTLLSPSGNISIPSGNLPVFRGATFP